MRNKEKRGKGKAPSTSKPDIRVRKAAYSKAVRAFVLANAAARQSLIDAGGENTIDVIREFDRDMSDEELAKRIGIKSSDVRALFLYPRAGPRQRLVFVYLEDG